MLSVTRWPGLSANEVGRDGVHSCQRAAIFNAAVLWPASCLMRLTNGVCLRYEGDQLVRAQALMCRRCYIGNPGGAQMRVSFVKGIIQRGD